MLRGEEEDFVLVVGDEEGTEREVEGVVCKEERDDAATREVAGDLVEDLGRDGEEGRGAVGHIDVSVIGREVVKL